MKIGLVLLLAVSSMRFEVTDSRGKKPSGVTIETGTPNADGWCDLKVVSKSKAVYTIVWPFDGKAKLPDGPEPIPVTVSGDEQPKKSDRRIAAYRIAGRLLSGKPVNDDASLEGSDDPLIKGVRLLAEQKFADAVDPLSIALKERERQLTRIPSEIYPAAMLYGKALMGAGKFELASVAFLKAMNLRPSDMAPRKARAEALIQAGKPEAAQVLMEK